MNTLPEIKCLPQRHTVETNPRCDSLTLGGDQVVMVQPHERD